MAQNVLLFTAAFLSALISGLLFAYSCSVNPGLHRLSDTAYLSAMQEINRAILNPAFFLCFLGPAILLPFSAWFHFGQNERIFWYLCGASLFYLAGVMGVTMFGNVPLNQALDTFRLAESSPAELAAQRSAFEGPWNSLHFIRTIASLVSLILILLGIFAKKSVTLQTIQ